MDNLGKSIRAYFENKIDEPVEVYIDSHFDHLMYPSVFFRSFKNMNKLERLAIQLCRGKILDVGAGAGCHSLYLKSKGFDVTSIDKSELCCETMKLRGLKNIICSDLLSFDQGKYDTILLLMNGLGIAGELNNVTKYLNHLKTLLRKTGKILVDSTDIRYTLSEEIIDSDQQPYYGETHMTMRFKNKEEPLAWLYIDSQLLTELSEQSGLRCVILKSDSKHRFLAQISCANPEAHP